MSVPDSPNDPQIDRLVVQDGGKVLIVHTLIGDVHITQETIQASKRKVWRPLSVFTYPSQRIEHDLASNYPSHLTVQLHKTFRDKGYSAFTGLISIKNETLMNMEISSVTLTTNQAAFIGAIHNSVKQLWDEKGDRLALQNALNAELEDLHSNWVINVRLFRDPGPIAYNFVYDPDAHTIFIGPYEKISATPSEYPDKVGCTRELLMLLPAVLRVKNLNAGNIETILRSYPLSKLFIELMDTKSVDFGRIRVNAADVEEWDYVNPSADEEFNRAGGR